MYVLIPPFLCGKYALACHRHAHMSVGSLLEWEEQLLHIDIIQIFLCYKDAA